MENCQQWMKDYVALETARTVPYVRRRGHPFSSHIGFLGVMQAEWLQEIPRINSNFFEISF